MSPFLRRKAPRGPTPATDPGPRPLHLACALLLAAAPGAAVGASLTVEGGPIVLGRTERATLLLELDAADDAAAASPRLAVNVGALDAVERVGPGRLRVRYTPPATRHPQVALLGWWRDGWSAPPEVLRVPLLGTTRLTVKAPPGRAVTVDVGGVRFGPVAADHRRTAVVPIEVPPGVARVTVTVAGGREAVTREVALGTPPASPDLVAPASAEPPPPEVPAEAPTPAQAPAPAPAPARAEAPVADEALRPPPIAARAAPRVAPPPDPALHLGVRAGYVRGSGALGGSRVALEAYRPFSVGGVRLGLGLAAAWGTASQRVDGGAGGLTSLSRASFVPVTLRLGWDAWSGRRASVALGAGATATIARFTNTLGPSATGLGLGGLVFAAAGWRAGPGQLFAELGFGTAPASAQAFRLEAGGAALDVGYRVRLP